MAHPTIYFSDYEQEKIKKKEMNLREENALVARMTKQYLGKIR